MNLIATGLQTRHKYELEYSQNHHNLSKDRRKRESLRLTQEQLATGLGLTSQYISILEQDKRSPSLSALAKIAEELGVTVDYLVSGKEAATLDLIPAIKADKTLDLEVKRSLITLVRELRRVPGNRSK
jgi:transcriptional regulator with XRE-family HTH domain